MVRIHIETLIAAPPEVCFDLARDLRAHVASTGKTRERVISGPPLGLMELGDEVTFEAVHFGIRQRLTSKITAYDRPNSFADRMLKGAFKSFEHTHRFIAQGDMTLMTDDLRIEAPLGPLGRLAELLFLRAYMTRFIRNRAMQLKAMSEAAS